MNAGSVKSIGGMVVMACLVVAVLTVASSPAVAQTPDAACAADSLYLISPAALDLRLETTGKPGLTISWPNLDIDEATCFSLDGTDNLGFAVEVTGGFGGQSDRVFEFTTVDAGTIGGPNATSVTVDWVTLGQANNGVIGGAFNLSIMAVFVRSRATVGRESTTPCR